jgi:hypothetical protein
MKIVVKKEMKPGEILEELLKKRGHMIVPIQRHDEGRSVYDVLGMVAEELFTIYKEHLKTCREEGTD